MIERINVTDLVIAEMRRVSALSERLDMRMTYGIVCVDRFGVPRWVEAFENLVTTAGKNDLLTQYGKGAAYTAAFYVGLISSVSYTTGPAVGNTSASHGGWTEDTTYSNGTRPSLTLGTASGGSIDNSASKAEFTINGTATIKGAFTITNNTKGGSTGTLYSAGTFAADRNVVSGDTLQVQITWTV